MARQAPSAVVKQTAGMAGLLSTMVQSWQAADDLFHEEALTVSDGSPTRPRTAPAAALTHLIAMLAELLHAKVTFHTRHARFDGDYTVAPAPTPSARSRTTAGARAGAGVGVGAGGAGGGAGAGSRGSPDLLAVASMLKLLDRLNESLQEAFMIAKIHKPKWYRVPLAMHMSPLCCVFSHAPPPFPAVPATSIRATADSPSTDTLGGAAPGAERTDEPPQLHPDSQCAMGAVPQLAAEQASLYRAAFLELERARDPATGELSAEVRMTRGRGSTLER